MGDVLQQRLAQAEEDAEELASLKRSYNQRVEEMRKMDEIIQTYRSLDERNAKLDEREQALNDRERKMDLERLQYQLEAEKDKTLHARSILSGLVRNTEYRSHVFDGEIRDGHHDHNGNWVPGSNVQKNFDKTTEAK